MCVNSVHFCHLVYSMFSQKSIFIFIFEYPLRIISELIKILVDTLIKYYTDHHDVDEDGLIVSRLGGRWNDAVFTGIAYRWVSDTSLDSSSDVASSNVQNVKLYGLAGCRRRCKDYCQSR